MYSPNQEARSDTGRTTVRAPETPEDARAERHVMRRLGGCRRWCEFDPRLPRPICSILPPLMVGYLQVFRRFAGEEAPP